MGGSGSGGHNSKGKLRDVQCARLDVHELAREGKLKLGSRGCLFGTSGLRWRAGLTLTADTGISLEVRQRRAAGPCSSDHRCYWRKAHYGGRYLMFLCSECHRSARVLYARYELKSRDLVLQMPQMRWHHLSVHHGPPVGPLGASYREIARRLQWRAGGTVPVKPRGMHEKTYQRILGMLAYHEAVRKQGASYARKYRPDRHGPICGDNAETGLQDLADGRCVEW